MSRKLAFIFGATVTLVAVPQVALACTGDACSAVSAGSWSSGKVTVTDKDSSGKIAVKVCFKDSKICNIWGINPGANSVVLAPPSGTHVPSNTSVEIVEASYSSKPTAAATFANLTLTNGTNRDMNFAFHDAIASQSQDEKSDTSPTGQWTAKAKQRPDGTIDVSFRNVIRRMWPQDNKTKEEEKASYYRCFDFKGQLTPGGEWKHTFTENEGRKC